MASVQIKRGTRAQIEAAKTANGLLNGEPYLITDESRLAVGTATNAYSDCAKKSEVDGKEPALGNPVTTGQILASTDAGVRSWVSQLNSILPFYDSTSAVDNIPLIPTPDTVIAALLVTNTPAGGIAATNVQAALNELDSEKAAASHTHVSADITDLVTGGSAMKSYFMAGW